MTEHKAEDDPGYQKFVNLLCDMTGDERKINRMSCMNIEIINSHKIVIEQQLVNNHRTGLT